jgi:hypothetical protein
VKSSSGESIVCVSRYAHAMPAERSNPHTSSASGSLETTVSTTLSSLATSGGYSSARQ